MVGYPKNFEVDEDEDGIVTITSTITNSNLTLSDYQVNQDVTEEIFLNFFHNTTKDCTSLSAFKRNVTEERIWLEAEFEMDNIFWVWWPLSHCNQLILVSVNSQDK
jgi:hypothetical protein